MRKNELWTKQLLIGGFVLDISMVLRKATKEEMMAALPDVKNLIKSLPKHIWRRYKKRSLDKIDMVVVHHSATTSGTAKSFARYHVNSRGWPGIGYHYVIDKDGTINQTNELENISYHVSGQNTNSIGICLVGDYDKQKPPAIQMDQCARLIVSLQNQLDQELKIRGHSAFSKKTCPGLNFNMEDIVNRVVQFQNNLTA